MLIQETGLVVSLPTSTGLARALAEGRLRIWNLWLDDWLGREAGRAVFVLLIQLPLIAHANL